MLAAANQPIYEGCREGLSKLSLAARMMNIKTDHNLPEVCMDVWAELFKEYLSEDNLCAESYYEIQKLVHSLSLPSEMIDVCIDNCMIYWRKDAVAGWEAGSMRWMGDGLILSVRMKTGWKDGEDGRLAVPFNPI